MVFALGTFPGMTIDRPGAAIIGALLMEAFRVVVGRDGETVTPSRPLDQRGPESVTSCAQRQRPTTGVTWGTSAPVTASGSTTSAIRTWCRSSSRMNHR